jgi:hypothetical protein
MPNISMNYASLAALLLMLLISKNASALMLPRGMDRRNMMGAAAFGLATALGGGVAPSIASAATIETSPFEGTFSDPINHPGGTRTIKLLDSASSIGDYRLAKVEGGGGRGEPKSFILPAIVIGDRAIIIDFSPKGGPRDFTGVLDGEGNIKFTRDGNKWPRL